MSIMATGTAFPDLRTKLIHTTIKLLAEQGPAAVQARSVANEVGVSTMAVYSHFGGMPELLRAVADQGFRYLASAFEGTPKTDDPVTDVFRLALCYRDVARQNPHLYDLMFGLSTRGAYRAIEYDPTPLSRSESPAFQEAFGHVVRAATRLIEAGRIRDDDPNVIAVQLWGFVHGFITLELAGLLARFDDSVEQILFPMAINMLVGLGDTPERAVTSMMPCVR